MITARDVIAEAMMQDMFAPHELPLPAALQERYLKAAAAILSALLSAPEAGRLELAAKLNPWRPIEEAPKDGTYILTLVPFLPDPKILFWAKYADDWRCPASEDLCAPYGPTKWQFLPAPPSEDK